MSATTLSVATIPATLTTKSGQIRWLASQGMKRGEIAKLLGLRYQHVRNVLIQPLKKEVATAAIESTVGAAPSLPGLE
jgi:hypothetical protein